MASIKIMVADCDETFTREIASFIERCPEFELVGIAGDGLTALLMAQTKEPDILLTDLLLPELDGISLLKALQKMPKPPMTIFLSDFYSHTSIENARKNGASYYVFKPIETPALIGILQEHAQLIANDRRNENLRNETRDIGHSSGAIYSIIRAMGFSSRYAGSGYIAESVALACESPLIVRNLSKELYNMLASRMHTSPSCIERSIRTAIMAANTNGKLENILGEPPTNKRCIQYILNQVKSSC